MKKLILLLVSAILLLSFTAGCGVGAGGDSYRDNSAQPQQNIENEPVPTAAEPIDAFALYTSMNSAFEDTTSMQAVLNMQMEMETQGETMTVSMSMGMQQIIRSETDIDMAMDMNVDMGEQGQTDMAIFYRDGWLYMDLMGMQIKTAVPIEDLDDYANTDMFAMIEFAKDAIIDTNVAREGRNTRLEFSLRGEALSETLNRMAGNLLGDTLDSFGASVSYGDVTVSALIDPDELPIEIIMVFSVEIELNGEVSSARYNITIGDLAFNTLTEIDFPSDLDSYMEVEM